MIKRILYTDLKEHLDRKEITFIVGPRQAGKTTLMTLLKEELEGRGAKTIYLNLDIEADREYFDSQQKLLKKISLEIGENGGFVFIDEIQRKENAGLFLKGLYDMNLGYKFIVSGSGSAELKENIHESLTGRKQIFKLPPLTFEEFVNFKTNYKYEEKLADYFELERVMSRQLLDEYLNFGGYPKVVLEKTQEEKQKLMAELYQSYLERDIVYLLGVQKSEDFTSLVRVVASQIGNLVNTAEISSTLGISVATVKKYLWYLENTFILAKVTPFFKNIRKEITKSPVFYFYDLGMRNYSLGIFGTVTRPHDAGPAFENFVFNIIKQKTTDTASRIHFWRTKDKAEVDFVVNSGKKVIPIEVKYKDLAKPELTRSFRSFIDKYKPQRGYIVHLGKAMRQKINTTTIFFMPYYKFFLEKL